MASVDNRIVRMEFDNAAFEARIKQTLSSLSGLDKALKMTGATKGLTDVSAAAKKVDLSPVADSANKLGAAFVAMSTIAVTALATVTHAAITSGARIANALSLEPVLDGFQEYELNLNSIQTILANTKSDGSTLEDVNAALAQLNEYSDQTIYNFGQMAKNIGTFTAAGIDLDSSVNAIKGISNLAAISGSSAEQASTAMYQLSQALSTGRVSLMDWNSVVNAGMGGEVFKKALFETGKAMKTITDVPLGASFEEWEKKGGSFRDQMQEGWITADVLSTTLQAFSGDLDEASLVQLGFSEAAAKQMVELGDLGIAAATEVKTFTQLMGTIKESVASGWSSTFRLVIGDFEQAKTLFTSINKAVGDMVSGSAERRNKLLEGWQALGGRDTLIKGLTDGFKALGEVIRPIREAFRDIFPPMTVGRLIELTNAFAKFTAGLRPSEKTIENIKRVFTGLFSILSIGWTIIKEGVGFLKDLVLQITGLGNGNLTEFTADIADFFTRLQAGLVKGEGIKRFFDNMSEAIPEVIQFFRDLKDAALGLFDNFDTGKADKVADSANRLSDRFGALAKILTGDFDLGPIQRFFGKVGDILSKASDFIGEWFGDLGKRLADAMEPGEFDAVLDALNVSLLGGIALLIGKFLKGGLNIDFGGGVLDGIRNSFEQLTGTLKAMQTQIKADALLKIAGAVALLTASVVALSLVDSAAMTRALVGMAVGFGQLVASFAIINQMDVGLLNGTTFAIISGGMIAMSTAILILSAAVTVFSKMDPGELARGLTGIAVAMGLMVASGILLAKNGGGILAASVGLGSMAKALTILAGAVAIFGNMDMDTLAKGFGAITTGLVLLVGASVILSKHVDAILLTSIALSAISGALIILAGAVALFGNMEWGTLIKGFASVGAGLLIIAGAMHLMPAGPQMLATSVALVAVGVALNIIALALKSMAEMKGGDIAKSIASVAAALIVLAIGMHAMNGAVAGAAAMVIAAVAMGILTKVLKEIAKIPAGDIVKGLVTIAAALTVFGIAAALIAPVVVPLLAMSVAVLALGAAFALFGVGALAAAKAFEIIAKVGPEAAEAITAALVAIGKGLPALIKGFAEGVLELIQVFADAAGPLAEALGVLLGKILDTMIELAPKFGELMGILIDLMITMVNEKSPALIEAGIKLLIVFLQGIRDNVYQMTDLVGQIMEAFLLAVGANAQDVTNAGFGVLISFLAGIGQNIGQVSSAVGKIISEIVNGMGNAAGRFVSTGSDVVVKLVNGMTNLINRVIQAGTQMATSFIQGVANSAGRLAASGVDAVVKFISGVANSVNRAVQQGVSIVLQFIQGVGSSAFLLATSAVNMVITFMNATASAIRTQGPQLRAAALNIGVAIVDGMSGGILSKAGDLANKAVSVAKKAIDAVKGFLGISSPSKLTTIMGGQFAQGFSVGMDKDNSGEKSAVAMAKRTVDALNNALTLVSDYDEFNPTVTPVLDLSLLRNGARDISSTLGDQRLSTDISYRNANAIATTAIPFDQDAPAATGPTEIKFEQNIHAPTQLSTGEIYRNTRNQITLAKEELDVA